MRRILTSTFVAIILSASANASPPDLPGPDTTGKADPKITAANYRHIMCKTSKTGKKYHTTDERRPTTTYTNHLKLRQLATGNYEDRIASDYEEDHLISLEIGGDDSAQENLWPEHWTGKWGAHVKDLLEGELGRRICLKSSDVDFVALTKAREIAKGNWVKSFPGCVCARHKKLSAKMALACSDQPSTGACTSFDR